MPRVLSYHLLFPALGIAVLCCPAAASGARSQVSVLVLLSPDRAGLRVGCRWESPAIGDKVTLRTHSSVWEAPPHYEIGSDQSKNSTALFFLSPHTSADLICATARPGSSIGYAITPGPRLRVSETQSPWRGRARCELWAGDAQALDPKNAQWSVRWWHGPHHVGSVTQGPPGTIVVSGSNATANPHSVIDPFDGDLIVSRADPPFGCISCQIVGSSFASHVAHRCWSNTGATLPVRGGVPTALECDCVVIAIRTGIFVAVAVAAASLLTGARRQLARSPLASGAVDEESVLPREPSRDTTTSTCEPVAPSVSVCYRSSPPLRERVRIRYAPGL
uniref:Membrane protein m165 n=1 Tax=Mastomys natalensis cytomegalovirus 1 TaxID=2973541 RepID=A0A9Y1IL33_9BETA|nr:membrane protein m165 [Mastomys natalensis cytomegalovirus 1]WEG69015.1 membrane protein m165 [Mastomys natalensis cytomegalovirus 1]WEG71243.1 membrane protein m165 [Mastomys natalensis cytomegalovirus 1]